jgi:DNA-binding CsgD family transcriptional regulator
MMDDQIARRRGHPVDPVLRFTAQQRRIADGITRELSYAEIGIELCISEHTVRAHVKQMALVCDEPRELPPRWRILFVMKAREWERSHAQQMSKPA